MEKMTKRQIGVLAHILQILVPVALVSLITLVLLPSGTCGGERIKMILTGRVSEGFLIRDWFLSDPLTDPLLIPSREHAGGYEVGRKVTRMYFPRSYQRVAEYDFVVFAGTDVLYFTQNQLQMIHDAVRDAGMGGINSRSLLSGIYYRQWVESPTQWAFPNDVHAVMSGPWWKFHQSMEIVLNEDPDLAPVLLMFKNKPIKWFLPDYDAMVLRPKEGATIWSWIKGPFPELSIPKRGWTPHLISWKYGEGITWTCHDRLANWWQDVLDANPYGLDMVMNMVLYSTGMDLPQDIELIHSIRRRFSEFRMRKRLILSTMEFGEKFGGSMARIGKVLGALNEGYLSAMDAYLEQKEVETSDMLDDLIAGSKEANEIATRELDRVLLWVHVINWLVVTATFMISGVVVWSLMVKRRLYREVGSTQLAGYRMEG
jgi:hypothetical protein